MPSPQFCSQHNNLVIPLAFYIFWAYLLYQRSTFLRLSHMKASGTAPVGVVTGGLRGPLAGVAHGFWLNRGRHETRNQPNAQIIDQMELLPHGNSSLQSVFIKRVRSFLACSRPERTPPRRAGRLLLERLEDRLTPSSYTVSNTNYSGSGSLGAAITTAVFGPRLERRHHLQRRGEQLHDPVE